MEEKEKKKFLTSDLYSLRYQHRISRSCSRFPQTITADRANHLIHNVLQVLMQFVGTLLVVISHLLITTRTGTGRTALARPAASPLPLAAAVFLSSLLWLVASLCELLKFIRAKLLAKEGF